jgi:hypothetical protein
MFYRRDSQQSAWKFHSQPQEICMESQSTVEDTAAHSEEISTETTAVVPVQTGTGTKYSDNLYSRCTFRNMLIQSMSQFHM